MALPSHAQLWTLAEQAFYFLAFAAFLGSLRNEGIGRCVTAMIPGGAAAACSVIPGIAFQGVGVDVTFDYWSASPPRSISGTIAHRNFFVALTVLTLFLIDWQVFNRPLLRRWWAGSLSCSWRP